MMKRIFRVLAALFFLVLPTSSFAIDKAEIDRMTYIGNANFHVRSNRSYDLPLALWAMAKRREAEPGLTWQQLADEANKHRDAYRENIRLIHGEFNAEQIAPAHAFRSFFEVMKAGDASVAISGAVANELLNWHYRELTEAGKLPAQRAAQAQLFTDVTLLSFMEDQIWSEVYERAARDKDFALAVDLVAAPQLFASVSASQAEIMEKNPAYAQALQTAQVAEIMQSGDLSTEQDVKDLEQRITTALLAKMDEVLKTSGEAIREAQNTRQSFERWAESEDERRQLAEAAQRERRVQQIELDMQRAGAYILGELLSTVDPTAGRSFGVLANAAIRAQEIRFDYLANMKLGGEAADLAFNAATLNYVALAFSVASAFGGGGDDGTGAILEALRQISQQIETLRQEMHDRFDSVDVRLESILSSLDRNFASIHADLDTLKTVTAETQRAALLLLSRAKHMDEAAALRAQSIVQIDFESTAARCYAYRGDTPAFTISDQVFVECLALFKQWALAAARDGVFDVSGTIASDFSDPSWSQLPHNAPLERVVSELHRMPGVSLQEAGAELGDVTIFYSGVDAYLAMIEAWPDHAARLVDTRSLDDFQNAIVQDARFRNSTLKSAFSSVVEAYLSESAYVRELLLAIAIEVNRDQLRLYGDNQLSLFRPASTQTYSRIGKYFESVPPCAPSASEAIKWGWPMKMLDYKGGLAKLPESWRRRFEAIDLVTAMFRGVTHENLAICYTLVLKPLQFTSHRDEDYGDTWWPNFYPVAGLRVTKQDQVLLELKIDFGNLGPYHFTSYLKQVSPTNYLLEPPKDYQSFRNNWNYATKMLENGLFASALLRQIEERWEKEPRMFRWPSDVVPEALPTAFENRLNEVAKSYVKAIAAEREGDRALSRAINRSTFLKNVIRRFVVSMPST